MAGAMMPKISILPLPLREGGWWEGAMGGYSPLPLTPQPLALVRFAAQARNRRGRML